MPTFFGFPLGGCTQLLLRQKNRTSPRGYKKKLSCIRCQETGRHAPGRTRVSKVLHAQRKNRSDKIGLPIPHRRHGSGRCLAPPGLIARTRAAAAAIAAEWCAAQARVNCVDVERHEREHGEPQKQSIAGLPRIIIIGVLVHTSKGWGGVTRVYIK